MPSDQALSTRRRMRFFLVCGMLAAAPAAFALTACAPAGRTVEVGLSAPIAPPQADFSSPASAVRAYTDHVAYAYRMADSELASRAATPYEGVRVDSYIELNRQKDRGIEQRLVKSTPLSISQDGTRTLVAVREDWSYRYFSLSKRQYVGPSHDASYDATYTLVHGSGGWLVDKVDAKALTPVD